MCSALRTANGSPRSGVARRHVAEVDHHRGGHRHPRVPLALGPDREREAAAGAQHAAHLAQRRRRVALQHVAEAREDAVDARVRRARSAPRRARGSRRSRGRARPRRGARPRPCSASGRSRSAGRAAPRRARGEEARSRPCPRRARGSSGPDAGSSRSTSHSRDLARRLLEQVAPPVPARRHLLPEVVVGAPSRREATARAAAASSSADGSHSPAAAFARTCSARGRARDHRGDGRLGGEAADRDVEQPRARGRARTPRAPRSGPRPTSATSSFRAKPSPARRARAGRRLVAAVLAGQQAAREREVREQAEPEPLAGGDQVVLGLALEPRVLVLRRHEPREAAPRGDRVRLLDLRGREVRRADVAHLARADELVHRAERLVERRHAVGRWYW